MLTIDLTDDEYAAVTAATAALEQPIGLIKRLFGWENFFTPRSASLRSIKATGCSLVIAFSSTR